MVRHPCARCWRPERKVCRLVLHGNESWFAALVCRVELKLNHAGAGRVGRVTRVKGKLYPTYIFVFPCRTFGRRGCQHVPIQNCTRGAPEADDPLKRTWSFRVSLRKELRENNLILLYMYVCLFHGGAIISKRHGRSARERKPSSGEEPVSKINVRGEPVIAS